MMTPQRRASFACPRNAALLCFVVLAFTARPLRAQDARSIVQQMVDNEARAGRDKPPEIYTADERSDRTAGHLWEERIAETDDGKLRRLVAEDGHPLTQEKERAEIARLRGIATDPRSFIASEKAKKDDEQHARDMLNLLPRAYLLQRLPDDGPWMRFNFQPDPAYTPRTYEERVMHGMSGSLSVDKDTLRLHHVEGRLASDVAIGFGLLAVVRSGSSFTLTRNPIPDGTRRTSEVTTDIQGRAVLFKTIARKQHTIHKDFSPLPRDVSIAGAVGSLTR